MSPASAVVPQAIASIQVCDDGETARFKIPTWGDRFDWTALAVLESGAGVEASLRLFLEEQLESGDVVLDLSPGAGFVALSAATSAAQPHVMALTDDAAHDDALRDASDAADVFIECIVREDLQPAELVGLVRDRLLDGQRLFIHACPSDANTWLEGLSDLADAGVIVAWCVGGEASEAERMLARALLVAHGFVPHVLAELDGEAQLFPADGAEVECIALHHSVFGGDEVESVATAEPRGSQTSSLSPANALPANPFAAIATSVSGLQFIAPFCRTGYGIAGAHLLRALMLRGATVNFFPLGTLDTSVLPFPEIADALAGQDDFDPTLPSVRLSQQFDLAMHAGRGPRVGYPIFELSRFSARERHHLASQDRLLVCSEWARSVLLENGISRTPVDIVPLGVDRGVFHERLDAGRARDETVFLQVGKLESRKGQLELLRAFEAAFTPKDSVRLVLACHNPFMDSDSFNRAAAPFRKSPMGKRITLHAKAFATQSDIAKLMASADCGVFVSRAEGWNLEALEMLSVGRAVIATNYSAHTEYVTESNARLIDIHAQEQVSGAVEGACWAAWGDAQHEQLVAHLRAVHAARQSGALGRNEAGIETAKRYSWDDSAIALLKALGSL